MRASGADLFCLTACFFFSLSLGALFSLRAMMPLHGMTLEDVADSELVKNAWAISYVGGGGGAGGSGGATLSPLSSPTVGPTAAPNTPMSAFPRLPEAATNSSGSGSISSDAQLQISPLHQRRSSDPNDGPLSPGSGGGGGGSDRKVVMVYARDAEQKQQWMADILSLIELTKQKKTTLGRQGAHQ